jgi:NADP-dependent 3-hydroxy acid dehydrogenase YdfG
VLETHFSSLTDILISNAADSRPSTIGEHTVQEIQESLISNIQTSVLIVDEAVKKKTCRKESRIMYISSSESQQPWSVQLIYAAGESLCLTWSMPLGGTEGKALSPVLCS